MIYEVKSVDSLVFPPCFQMDTTAEGRTYVERYQVADFPHVAILDPRTGRLIWRKEGWTQVNPLTAMDFAVAITST